MILSTTTAFIDESFSSFPHNTHSSVSRFKFWTPGVSQSHTEVAKTSSCFLHINLVLATYCADMTRGSAALSTRYEVVCEETSEETVQTCSHPHATLSEFSFLQESVTFPRLSKFQFRFRIGSHGRGQRAAPARVAVQYQSDDCGSRQRAA